MKRNYNDAQFGHAPPAGPAQVISDFSALTKPCHADDINVVVDLSRRPIHRFEYYWNGQLVWTPALSTLFVGDRGLYPAGIIAHLRLYRHIRQAAIREFFLFAVGSHAVIIYFGWLGLALYNIVVRIMVRVDVRVRVTQGL